MPGVLLLSTIFLSSTWPLGVISTSVLFPVFATIRLPLGRTVMATGLLSGEPALTRVAHVIVGYLHANFLQPEPIVTSSFSKRLLAWCMAITALHAPSATKSVSAGFWFEHLREPGGAPHEYPMPDGPSALHPDPLLTSNPLTTSNTLLVPYPPRLMLSSPPVSALPMNT